MIWKTIVGFRLNFPASSGIALHLQASDLPWDWKDHRLLVRSFAHDGAKIINNLSSTLSTLESHSSNDGKLVARPDALLCKGKEEAYSVASAVEGDNKKVPSRCVWCVHIHEWIWPSVTQSGRVQRPLEECVRGTPENEIRDSKPRKTERVQGELKQEKNNIHCVHVDVNETVTVTCGEHQWHQEAPVHHVCE